MTEEHFGDGVKPLCYIKVPSQVSKPGQFIVRARGNCLDSARAPHRVKDGSLLVCRSIKPEEVYSYVGQIVGVRIAGQYYVKQLTEAANGVLELRQYFPPLSRRFPIELLEKAYAIDYIMPP